MEEKQRKICKLRKDMMKFNKYTKSLIVIVIYLLLYYLMWEIHYGTTFASILYVVNTILMIPGMIPAAFFAPNFHLINPTLTLIFNCIIYGIISLNYFNNKENKVANKLKKNEELEKSANNSDNLEQFNKEPKVD